MNATIRFIGVGGAFAPIARGQSNMLITAGGQRMLIDCGMTAPYILRDEWGLHHHDIDAVWVSHLHADHIGGLEWLALARLFMPKRDKAGQVVKVRMYANIDVMRELWETSLKGGLQSVEGRIMNLTDYFECVPITANDKFLWQDHEFTPVQTIHVMSGYVFRYSFGLLVRRIGRDAETPMTTFITTDTQFCPHQLRVFYERADRIFHDCETSQYPSHVHAHYDDLRKLNAETKKKMWLYHYGDKVATVADDGFAGFVDKGQEFALDFDGS